MFEFVVLTKLKFASEECGKWIYLTIFFHSVIVTILKFFCSFQFYYINYLFMSSKYDTDNDFCIYFFLLLSGVVQKKLIGNSMII